MEIPLSEYAICPEFHEATTTVFDLATSLLGPGTLAVGQREGNCISLLKVRSNDDQFLTEGQYLSRQHPLGRLLGTAENSTVFEPVVREEQESSAYEAGTWSVLAAPVTLRDGVAFGTLAFISRVPRALDPGEIDALTGLALLLGNAIDVGRFSGYDPLTGLYARSLLDDHLRLELARARRNGAFLAVLLVSFDLPKPQGKLIRRSWVKLIAERLRSSVRTGDTVARVGAAEFALIAPDLRDLLSARRVAQSLLDSLSDPYVLGDDSVVLAPSIGVAVVPWDGHDPDGLVSIAASAMQDAQRAGGDRFHFHSEHRHLRLLPSER